MLWNFWNKSLPTHAKIKLPGEMTIEESWSAETCGHVNPSSGKVKPVCHQLKERTCSREHIECTCWAVLLVQLVIFSLWPLGMQWHSSISSKLQLWDSECSEPSYPVGFRTRSNALTNWSVNYWNELANWLLKIRGLWSPLNDHNQRWGIHRKLAMCRACADEVVQDTTTCHRFWWADNL